MCTWGAPWEMRFIKGFLMVGKAEGNTAFTSVVPELTRARAEHTDECEHWNIFSACCRRGAFSVLGFTSRVKQNLIRTPKKGVKDSLINS